MSVRSDWPAFAGIDWGGEHCQRGDAGRWDWHLCMLDGSLVGVEFDKDPKVSKLSRAWERTRHWPVDPAATTTPSARVRSGCEVVGGDEPPRCLGHRSRPRDGPVRTNG